MFFSRFYRLENKQKSRIKMKCLTNYYFNNFQKPLKIDKLCLFRFSYFTDYYDSYC